MSSLVKNGTIRIDSVGGERRFVGVSGRVKVRSLWLFRNFWILDFPVLNRKQQELIAQLWHAGQSAGPGEAPEDLIGAIEGFLPQRYTLPEKQPEKLPVRLPAQIVATAKLPPAKPSAARLPAAKPRRWRVRFVMPKGLRIPAMWAATSVLLLGCAMFLGASLRSVPRSRVVGAAADNAVAVADDVAATNADAAPEAVAPGDDAASDNAVADSNVVTPDDTVTATNRVSSTVTERAATSAESAPPVEETPAAATDASSTPRFHPPDAMAYDASVGVNPPRPTDAVAVKTVAVKARAAGKQEVVISVSVDRDGRAMAFRVLRGDQKKVSAALHAAKRWSFQPCSGAEDCEHLLKFTDYGDASIVQMID